MVVPSGTEAPVVPSRMTLSVECPSMQSHRRQAQLHSFPKAITPQVVLEELGLVSYRHPESQALIRTKVSIPIDIPDPLAKAIRQSVLSYRLLNKVTGVSCRVPRI